MNVVYFILYLLAVLCFVGAVAGVSIQNTKRNGQAINLTALGLAFFAAVPLIISARAL